MTIKGRKSKFDQFIRRSQVPRGFRPESDQEIEMMLDALGPCELPNEKCQQMLRKICGQEPMVWEIEIIENASPILHKGSTAEVNELVEMFRSKGSDIPPNLEEKLRELEKQAAEEYDEEKEELDG
ncbi:MAG: hypothetical protein CME32_27935 [Gimesia sp.]|nr:hypothetical protein [Gimesia sp.]